MCGACKQPDRESAKAKRPLLSFQENMIMDALRNVLTRLQKQGAALGHFNVADLVLLKAVVAAAVEVGVPVLVGASEGERDFLGTDELAALVKSLREESRSASFS